MPQAAVPNLFGTGTSLMEDSFSPWALGAGEEAVVWG